MRVNVRLVAATNREIVKAIKAGDFREDLYHRLNVVQFNLPPLRERDRDMILLAEYFLKGFCTASNKDIGGFSEGACHKLLAHQWPGNVRELRNAVERALIFETSDFISPSSLPDWGHEERLTLSEMETEMIKIALLQNESDVAKAASALGISKILLQEKLQQIGIKNADKPTSTTVAVEASSGPLIGGQPSGRRFWELLKERGFKLWEIVNPESVRAQAAEALKNATLNDVSSPTTAGQNAGTSNPTRKTKAIWRLDGFVPPPPFKVSYVNPMSCEIEKFEIHWGSDYHPEPNYFKSLYAPKHGTYQIPFIRAAIYRYAVEHNISKFRKAFEKMSSTVIDDKLAGLVKGSGKGKFKTGAVNLWETESKGKEETSAFRPCTGILRNNSTKVDQEIKNYFPDYKRPTV